MLRKGPIDRQAIRAVLKESGILVPDQSL
jgi:hypothetical protein